MFPLFSPQEFAFQAVAVGIFGAGHRLVDTGHARIVPAAGLVGGAISVWTLVAAFMLGSKPVPHEHLLDVAVGFGGLAALGFAIAEYAGRSKYWSRNII